MDIESLFSVKGKTVLVTGGAKGIGRMISEGFVRNGAKVYITSRDAAACTKAVEELNALSGENGAAIAIPADLSSEDELGRLVSELSRRETKLDVLVNNAGTNWGAPYASYPSSAWTRVLTLNLQRVFQLTQQLTPLLAAASSSPARIIHIGSVFGIRVPALETYAYSASKAGLHHLSRVLANRLGSMGITSNVVACGAFETKMMAATLKIHRRAIVDGVPLARLGSPQDIAGTCLWLASRAGAYVTGATIAVDGGSVVSAKL